MKKINNLICVFAGIVVLLLTDSCKKQNEWLDIKSQNALVVPETLKDFQALLDNSIVIHNTFPIFGLVGGDNFYITDTDFSTVPETERNGYKWSDKIWSDGNSVEWNSMYGIIEYANIVLDGLQKKGLNVDQSNYNNIKGQALFYRAIALYNLAQLFCNPYSAKASADLGLPLRTSSDVNIIHQRSTLQETYNQIISDTDEAISLLQVSQLNNRRPGKGAANALLAKVYLVMENYSEANFFADEAIKIKSTLIDYNSGYASIGTTYRFPANALDNTEILWYAQGGNYPSVMPATISYGMVAPDLTALYNNNDLRKTLFYVVSGTGYKYRGSYTGLNNDFCGIGVNEVYLIRAESSIRLHNVSGALADLNVLLRKRYKTGTYTDYILTDEEQILRLVLNERRKELPFVSNLRWEDLRRLNKDDRFKTIITRTLLGTTYVLQPGSLKYTLPIPDNEVQISGLQQNQR